MYFPKKASQAMLAGDFVQWDGSGGITVCTSSTAAGGILGVIKKTIASTDADYAATTPVPVEVPVESFVEWRVEAAGTAVATDVGKYIDLTDANTANRAASTNDPLLVTKFISATELVVTFEYNT